MRNCSNTNCNVEFCSSDDNEGKGLKSSRKEKPPAYKASHRQGPGDLGDAEMGLVLDKTGFMLEGYMHRDLSKLVMGRPLGAVTMNLSGNDPLILTTVVLIDRVV